MEQDREQQERRRLIARRRLMKSAAWMAGAVATGTGSWIIPADGARAAAPIKVGIATDLTGALGFEGNSDLNVAKMCADLINQQGGLLGRPLHLYVEDTATNEAVAVGNVRKLITRDHVDVVLGGITSSMRNAIKGVIVARGRTLYLYPQLYEGGECEQYIYCTGPTPAQQCDDLIPWLIQHSGKRFAFPSANYIWPHRLNQYARKLVQVGGGEVIFEEYYPIDQMDYSATVNKIMREKVDVVFNTVIPPGVGPFFKQLYDAGFLRRGGRLCCVYYDENDLNINSPEEIAGLASCLDYFQGVAKIDPGSAKIQDEYNRLYPHTKYLLAAGSAATGMYRGMMLWAEAVKQAGKLDREDVAHALDHAKIAIGPGGPAEMVPGHRHCRMRMYIGVAKGPAFDIVSKSNGLLDPKEC
jgi:ABC-type branched-subunit amino acid transport system substrate-binding protein